MIEGSDSELFLNYVITNDVSRLSLNSAQYTVMCNERGGIIDDFIVYRLETEKFIIVPNATNRAKDYNWLAKNTADFNVKTREISDEVAMLAVQGPNARETLQKISSEDISKIERFKCMSLKLANIDVFLSKTGYTGEEGFEVFIWNASLTKPENATRLWTAIFEAGKPFGIEACGLAARDTLRLEAGLCLYGNDIDENTSPLEASLSFVAKLQKENFIGKEALLKQKIEGVERKRVGIIMIDQGIPRPNYEIYNQQGENIGRVTSGTFSPLLKCGMGMAYLKTSQAQDGNIVEVKIRDRLIKGKVASFPLYDPEKYGAKRKSN